MGVGGEKKRVKLLGGVCRMCLLYTGEGLWCGLLEISCLKYRRTRLFSKKKTVGNSQT